MTGNDKELEAVLMDYIERYGLTEKARAFFFGRATADKSVSTRSTLTKTQTVRKMSELDLIASKVSTSLR